MSDRGRHKADAAPTSRAPAPFRQAPSPELCLLLTLVILITGSLVIGRRRTPRFELPRGNALVIGAFGSPVEAGKDEAAFLVVDCCLAAAPSDPTSAIDLASSQIAVDQALRQHGAIFPTHCSLPSASVRLAAWSARL